MDPVQEAQVDDVDHELGVDHVLHGLGDVLDSGAGLHPRAGQGLLDEIGRPRGRLGGFGHNSSFAPAWTRSNASRTAAQPSIAHFTLAGNWATPRTPPRRRTSPRSARPSPALG